MFLLIIFDNYDYQFFGVNFKSWSSRPCVRPPWRPKNSTSMKSTHIFETICKSRRNKSHHRHPWSPTTMELMKHQSLMITGLLLAACAIKSDFGWLHSAPFHDLLSISMQPLIGPSSSRLLAPPPLTKVQESAITHPLSLAGLRWQPAWSGGWTHGIISKPQWP